MPESTTPPPLPPSDGTGKPGAVALRFSMLIVLLLTLGVGGFTAWAIYDLIQNPNSGDLNALFMPLTFLTFTAGIMVLYQMWHQSRRAYKTLIYAAIFPVLWTASSSFSFTLPYDLIYPVVALLIIIALLLYWRVPKTD